MLSLLLEQKNDMYLVKVFYSVCVKLMRCPVRSISFYNHYFILIDNYFAVFFSMCDSWW